MRTARHLPLLALLGIAAAPLLVTRAAAQRSPAPSDSAARDVRATIDRLFDGMRRGDSAAAHSVFHPQARLQSASIRQGQPMLRTDSIDAFVRAIGTPHKGVWDERVSNVEIHVDDPLATAWMRYAFYLDSTFSHCGVDAFQLVRTSDGWKVLQITDTRQSSCSR
ncbi:MAG TPA: nuclear transport factor 2 family protein [Gemmatimonadaceae bacterium]|nr:nuclear transport factor 2 family protein [Gemmatimonadaceae bacterium]